MFFKIFCRQYFFLKPTRESTAGRAISRRPLEKRYTSKVHYAMLFSWDKSKRRENWEVRKVDFLEAALIFEDPEVIESVDPPMTMANSAFRRSVRWTARFTWSPTHGAEPPGT